MTVAEDRVVDCPFSLAIDFAPIVFPAIEGGEFAARLPLRAFLPFLSGAIARRVRVRFSLHNDPTEPGLRHDEMHFDWDARTRLLPNLSGILRFRIEGTQTRISLEGVYSAPFGPFGKLFDRTIGTRLAHATARDFLDRTALALEARWAAERRKAGSR